MLYLRLFTSHILFIYTSKKRFLYFSLIFRWILNLIMNFVFLKSFSYFVVDLFQWKLVVSHGILEPFYNDF